MVIRSLSLLVMTLVLQSCFSVFTLGDFLDPTAGELPIFPMDNGNWGWFVAEWGSDSNPGSQVLPLRSIQVALNKIRTNPSEEDMNFEIRVAAGDYRAGQGLSATGRYGFYIDYSWGYGAHRSDGKGLAYTRLTLSFGWDRLFRSNQAPVGGTPSRLYSAPVYEATAVLVQNWNTDQGLFESVSELAPGETPVYNSGGTYEFLLEGNWEVLP